MLFLAGLLVAAAEAAPDGFRRSEPLSQRAAKLAWNQKLTVHCARTEAIYRDTGASDDTGDSDGRASRATKEVELPPRTCLPMEQWLRGKRVSRKTFAYALFVLAHEVGHIKNNSPDEDEADCYASKKYTALARLFGVKSASTLRELRIYAPLLDVCR